MLKPELNDLFKKEAKKWIINNPIKFIKIGTIRVKNTSLMVQEIYISGERIVLKKK